MGIYLNPRNSQFLDAREKELYVDKSLLIDKVWTDAHSLNQFICFSRPRRFGKSTDANMLTAFFSKGCDSADLFADLKVAWCANFETKLKKHMNSHNVIHLDVQKFLSAVDGVEDLIHYIYDELSEEIFDVWNITENRRNLSFLLAKCYAKTGERFIFIVDEWDCVFREFKADKEAQKRYLDYLRLLFKEQPYVEFVYMTGILPIRKYGTHSALNMFDEISMLDAKGYSGYVGFTGQEVEELCKKHGADFELMKDWYDGYLMNDGTSTYSPRSVTASIYNGDYANYWSQTETYEALKEYIDLNYDGLKDDIVRMLAGEKTHVNVRTFSNAMDGFATKDDVMTLLIHLGYLGYLGKDELAYIPNREVKNTFIDSIQTSDWDYISKVFRDSNDLLEATWNGQADRVAAYIESSHYETSILQYNDENALAYTVSLAYITARQKYTIIRELPTGKGFADIVFIPRKGADVPAMVVELKFDNDADSGIRQIKEKKYFLGLEEYLDNLLLVSISYNRDKKHVCVIETMR